MKNLQLSLKRQWFEITKAGIKTEDYRNINEYWIKRLVVPMIPDLSVQRVLSWICDNDLDLFDKFCSFKHFDTTTLTLGYPKSTDIDRILTLEHKGIVIGYGKEEWGAEPNKLYFIIKHGERL
jgi:hypothetical protein